MSSLELFHPVIQQWFLSRFAAPTEPQERGWPAIAEERDLLIAAPTGSGKTLTAFLAAIDTLYRQSVTGGLRDEIRVVYVSPLRALSADMHRNLEQPLTEIAAVAAAVGQPIPQIRTGLRTGDTTASQRAAILRRPPQILVTTPESLYLMLTSRRAREILRTVRTVIVDEIHALVRDKRGSHLALTLERLAAVCPGKLQRIGLSATQRPIDAIAAFLVGGSEPAIPDRPVIVDIGHQRELDLGIEVPASDLGAVCRHEQWSEINARIVELIQSHRATLIFVNTRRLAERLTHQLSELLGEGVISSHHGSLAFRHRHDTEWRLKHGELRAVVATASLEMGIDVGLIDLVIQIGSPRNIATLLQRIGRSGHALGLIPKGRVFALTRDELLECMALLRAVRAGRLDSVSIPRAPLDVLAQQIVAEVACREWSTDELFALCCRAAPYRDLSRRDFDRIVQMLAEGLTPATGRARVFLHHDQVGRRLRARPAARMAAIANAGAIPEVFAIRVVTEDEQTVVGTVDEDFGIESQAGDIFLLGNNSWRIRWLRRGDLVVTDAGGAPPTIPFWRGEAPGRTYELSEEVSRLREELSRRLDDLQQTEQWLVSETGVSAAVARQAVAWVSAQQAAIGLLPTMRRVVFERFFDESGGMQLVIHAPFGMRITRAWGLALRKRFCRSFDFELQASADDDGIVLSLGPQHSFPIEALFGMLNSRNVRQMFEQAVLAMPLFQNRWRWNATRALQVPRSRNGLKVPPALQRFRSEDLLTAVFPKLTGCQENVVGDIQIPDVPLVQQTLQDCLTEAHDLMALEDLLSRVERGEIEFLARDTREPSPFCYELLNGNPYAFLDGGEIAERRARAVATRRSLSAEDLRDLGQLDPEAIRQVVAEAQPLVRNADELHDVLLSRIWLPEAEASEWPELMAELLSAGRATTLLFTPAFSVRAAAERIPAVLAAFPEAIPDPLVCVPADVPRDWEATTARVAALRGLLETCGPVSTAMAAQRTGMTLSQADAGLQALEGEGVVLRGQFTASSGHVPRPPDSPDEVEWCHRRLLARIHRMTLDGLRKQIEPVGVDVFFRFLTRHQGLTPAHRRAGTNGLYEVVGQLQGLDLTTAAWEKQILPQRLDNYRAEWLDELCLTGEVGWARLFPPARLSDRSRPMTGLTRTVPISLFLRDDLLWLRAFAPQTPSADTSGPATEVCELLEARGAMFTSDLRSATQMLPDHLDDAIGELVARGLVTADGFAGLRRLIERRSDRIPGPRHHRGERRRATVAPSGRWCLAVPCDVSATRQPATETDRSIEPQRPSAVRSASESCGARQVAVGRPPAPCPTDQPEVDWAWQLLRRWGVVFRDLLERETGAPPWILLLQVFRRLEARGEIRGGRFVAGVAGEQFALSESVEQLRRLRDGSGTVSQNDQARETPELVVVCGADPFNLTGILTPRRRVPATAANFVAWLNGCPVAALQGGEVLWFECVPPAIAVEIEQQFRGTE